MRSEKQVYDTILNFARMNERMMINKYMLGDSKVSRASQRSR